MKTVFWISSPVKVIHLISEELYQKQNGFKFIYEILVALHENWLSLWRGHFFHPYDLVLISELSKRSRLYHFNVLKCNLCFVINIWQKFKSYSKQFQYSNLRNVAEGILIVFPWTQRNYDYRFMKERMIFLTPTWLPNSQFWATV